MARGCGWQKIGACINLGAFYVVGLPAAYLVAFVLRIGGMVLFLCCHRISLEIPALPSSIGRGDSYLDAHMIMTLILLHEQGL